MTASPTIATMTLRMPLPDVAAEWWATMDLAGGAAVAAAVADDPTGEFEVVFRRKPAAPLDQLGEAIEAMRAFIIDQVGWEDPGMLSQAEQAVAAVYPSLRAAVLAEHEVGPIESRMVERRATQHGFPR